MAHDYSGNHYDWFPERAEFCNTDLFANMAPHELMSLFQNIIKYISLLFMSDGQFWLNF